MPIQLQGLDELRAALKETEGASVREISSGLKASAIKLTAAAKGNIHDKSGALSADARPFSTSSSAGVRFTLDYAPVVEFAGTWHRRPPGQGKGTHHGALLSARAAAKSRADRRVLQKTGQGTVHYHGATPRFAFRAVDELGPALIDEVWEALVQVLTTHGWFRET